MKPCLFIYIYIYIYIERERERWTDRQIDRQIARQIHIHKSTVPYRTQKCLMLLVTGCFILKTSAIQNKIRHTGREKTHRSSHCDAENRMSCPTTWKNLSCAGFHTGNVITNVRNTRSPVDCTAVPKPVATQKYKGYCCVD